MTQYLYCQYIDHEEELIKGFCLNQDCQQIPQFCLKCLQDKHAGHVQDCKFYKQYQDLLKSKLNEYQKEINQLNEMYKQVEQQYKSHSKHLTGEIRKLQELINLINNEQYYDMKSLLISENVSNIIVTQNENQHVLDFTQTLEDTLQWIKQLNFNQSIINWPQSQALDKRKAQQEFIKGQSLFNLQNYQEAVLCFNESIKHNPNLDDIYRWKARTLNKLGLYEEAIYACNMAIQINDKNDSALSTKAGSLQGLGRNDEALKCCDQAIEINPQNEQAHINKGLALGNLGRHDEELMYYDKAIELNKNNEAPYINKCWTLIYLKQFNLAIKCGEDLIKINPNLDQAYNIKGVALQNLKQYKEAIIQFDQAYQISNKVDYLVAKADALFISGQKKQSKQFYVEALNKGYPNKQYIELKLKSI